MPLARLRHAIKSSTSWWVTVRYAKRGRSRVVPLDDDALEAIIAPARRASSTPSASASAAASHAPLDSARPVRPAR